MPVLVCANNHAMKHRKANLARAVILMVPILVMTACIPNTLTLSLDNESSALKKAQVFTDDGRTEGAVALIHVGGVINDVTTGLTGSAAPIDSLVTRLDMARKDTNVKAVVLRINSPGGSVTASDVMYREIRRFRDETGKPVVASFGEIAASGGYYISLATDHIVAHPTTITGSIGVIIPNVNISLTLTKFGVRTNNIVSGPNKAMGDPLSPPNLDHEQLFQAMVDQFYERFRTLVIERRSFAAQPIDAARVNDLTDGRVVTGADAIEAGLVDSLGSIHDAFDVAKQLAGIERAQLIVYHAKTNAFRPRSPYASVGSIVPQTGTTASLSIGSVDLPLHVSHRVDASQLTPGMAYYLWPMSIGQ